MADEDLDLDGDDDAPKSSKKMLIIIIVGVLLLAIVAAVGTLFVTGAFDDEKEATESSQSTDTESDSEKSTESADDEEGTSIEVTYWPLEPPFVLNFEGKSKARYMQVGLEISTVSGKAHAAVKKHMPVLRNEIVLLLSGQKYEEMVTPDGKEQLRAELIETINNVLKQHGAKKGIDKIYFTSFVMQ